MSSDVDLDSRFPQIAAQMGRNADRDETAIAREIAREAKVLAPRLDVAINYPSTHRVPGALAASISAHGEVVTADIFYAAYVEYGTNDTPTQPFLRPAAHSHEPELIREVRESLKDLE